MDIAFASASNAKRDVEWVSGISLSGISNGAGSLSSDSDRMLLARQTHKSALRHLCSCLGYGHVIPMVIGILSTHPSRSCPSQLSLRSIHNALFTRLSAFLETNRAAITIQAGAFRKGLAMS